MEGRKTQKRRREKTKKQQTKGDVPPDQKNLEEFKPKEQGEAHWGQKKNHQCQIVKRDLATDRKQGERTTEKTKGPRDDDLQFTNA